jgi:hypothetical protein
MNNYFRGSSIEKSLRNADLENETKINNLRHWKQHYTPYVLYTAHAARTFGPHYTLVAHNAQLQPVLYSCQQESQHLEVFAMISTRCEVQKTRKSKRER